VVFDAFHRVAPGRVGSVLEHGADRLALVHQVEGVVDLVEPHGVGDEGRQVDAPAIASSTMPGSSLRPLTPPKAVPSQRGR
jgi:hypothetical protein